MAAPVGANANANANVDQKVLQYENFINEVLKTDLQKVLDQRDSVYEKISQYLQLKNTIQSLQESGSQRLKTDVDLGCNFYVQAEVEDASRIFVAVGYGFFVEMTTTKLCDSSRRRRVSSQPSQSSSPKTHRRLKPTSAWCWRV